MLKDARPFRRIGQEKRPRGITAVEPRLISDHYTPWIVWIAWIAVHEIHAVSVQRSTPRIARASVDPSYISEMASGISVQFSHLVLYHREIGIHRGRRAGFRDVFSFRTLHDLPFIKLASKVKAAYEGRDVPSHDGWPAQREALRWFVEQGRDAIYALDSKPIKVRHCPYQRYYIADGHHRALALYILGESTISAKVKH